LKTKYQHHIFFVRQQFSGLCWHFCGIPKSANKRMNQRESHRYLLKRIPARGRASMKLTDTFLRNLKTTGKVQKHSDGGGLYLQISPSGGKLAGSRYY
jgi:hypothetical protein